MDHIPARPADHDAATPYGQRGERIVAFEFESEGHHASYVRSFARVWAQAGAPASLDLVVTPEFLRLHGDVVAELHRLADASVRLHAITEREHENLERTAMLRYFKAWQLVCRYAETLRADHALVMYFDFFLLPTVLGRLRGHTPPCAYSGIYFRPTFHYPRFRNYRSSWKERARAFRKQQLLGRVLKDPRLAILYCLDPFAVDYITSHFETTSHILPIADAFTRYDRSLERVAQIRSELRIEPQRLVFCLLGILDGRKGVTELLECLRQIPRRSTEKMCLLLAGRIEERREHIARLIEEQRRTLPIQIVLHDRYVPDDQVQHYYDLSDVILATYQEHMGSSATLIRAGLAQKPVLSADYGLMGEIVTQRRLGVTVNTADPMDMALGIQRFLEEDPSSLFDASEAARFAEEHSPERLAGALRRMLRQPSG